MLDHKDWNKQKCMEFICDKIATSTYGLGTIIEQGKKEHGKFPGYSTIFSWLKAEEDGKSPGELIDLYARAKEYQADYMADEILDIADDARNDWMEKRGANGETYETLNSEHVQRSRLRIDSRKWLAGKLRPRMYGDKIQQEISGRNGKPIEVITAEITDEDAVKSYMDMIKQP